MSKYTVSLKGSKSNWYKVLIDGVEYISFESNLFRCDPFNAVISTITSAKANRTSVYGKTVTVVNSDGSFSFRVSNNGKVDQI